MGMLLLKKITRTAWGTSPAEALKEQLGARLADAHAQAQGWHPERVVLQQLMVALLMMARCMQMEMGAGALWPAIPSGDCLAALQQ